MQVEIENRLRKEIISGYQKYLRKLGLNSKTSNPTVNLTDDNITFNIKASAAEKAELKRKVMEHPELYH
jgi:hypothetical protein